MNRNIMVNILIGVTALVMLFAAISCTEGLFGSMDELKDLAAEANAPQVKPPEDKTINAQYPQIVMHPQGRSCGIGAAGVVLNVAATVDDGGTKSYQWYKNSTNSLNGGIAIEGSGADTDSYYPSVAALGTTYYWVVVTNTNNSVDGNKTASTTSIIVSIIVNNLENAQQPTVSSPLGATYTYKGSASAITVTASSPDGGTISYKWYNNGTTNSNVGGTQVGTNSNSYTPGTDATGTTYYYVEVTNTIDDNHDGGSKSAAVKRGPVAITVNPIGLGINISAGPGSTLTPINSTSPAYSERSATFTVQVNNLHSEANASGTALVITAVPGLTFSGHNTTNAAAGGIKTFTVTITYNGTQAFETGSQTISVTGLTGIPTGHAYSGGTKTTTVTIIDGQAAYIGSGTDRRIPVTSGNITAFNSYAGTEGLSRHYKLVGIINNLPAAANNWTAIGNETNPFSGSFDGDNNYISGLSINSSSDYQGMFGKVSGTVKKLGLLNCSIIGGNSTGSLVGYLLFGTVENCYATTANSASVSGGNYTGGIAGIAAEGTIRNCYFAGTVTGATYAGGIVGENRFNNLIENCYSTGSVSAVSDYAGGIVGSNSPNTVNGTAGIIQYCYSVAAVSANDNAGGIAGSCHRTGSIKNSVALSSNVKISQITNIGRVSGYRPTTPNPLMNNYARTGMTLTNSSGTSVPSSATLTHINGKDTSEYDTQYFWTNAANWDTSAWSVGTLAGNIWMWNTNSLPVLRNMPSGYTQNHTVP